MSARVIDEALIDRHCFAEQVLRRAENVRYTHTDMSVVTHKAGKLQVPRVRGDRIEHLPERGVILHTAAMQSNVDLDVGSQPGAELMTPARVRW